MGKNYLPIPRNDSTQRNGEFIQQTQNTIELLHRLRQRIPDSESVPRSHSPPLAVLIDSTFSPRLPQFDLIVLFPFAATDMSRRSMVGARFHGPS